MTSQPLASTSNRGRLVTQSRALAPINTLSHGNLRPVGSVDPSWAWTSLSADNEATCDMTTNFALGITPKEEVVLRLTPAVHLLSAAQGTSDVRLAISMSAPLAQSVKPSTRITYGQVIVQYLRWCEEIGLPPHFRFPAATNIRSCFLTHDQDKRRASTSQQKTYALMYWHRIQKMPWALDSSVTRLLRRSAKLEGLPLLEKRRPVRLPDLQALRQQANLCDPSHMAVWAAALFAFFAMCRPGEISVRTLSADTAERARWSGFSSIPARGARNIASVILKLPSEKVHGAAGFDRIVAQQRQMPGLCPVAAFHQHQATNGPRPAEAPSAIGAFSYITTAGQRRELTESHFSKTINAWLKAAGRERVSGHCFRIGGATFFFSAGKPLDDIRVRGGWESDAYLVYIRDSYVRHAELFGDVDATHLFYG
ncbi:hypothetical protein A4X13_0g8556 [Tilletia indica]|uniref:Tyr recombinase domain-containing protein n=1 Tax=Tilletia indica TaxID=43049 RepID=A0A8T8SE97_9BASI|nr:hypothetical protein A4X13_0g8556 [Tilletia indica]